MKELLTFTTTVVLLIGLVVPIYAQDPFDGGFSIPLDYGQLIATMGERNDSLQGWIFDWLPAEDSIVRLSAEGFPDGYQCGDDRDFAAADFNGDYMEEIVVAWNRSDGGVFVAIPTYDLVNMVPLEWNTPDPPIAAGVLYATDTLAEVLGEIRVAAGNFYADSAMEFVLAYLAADSTVSITVFDVDTSGLTPEAKGSISDQAINTEIPEVQRFGTASRFDIATGDMNNDGIDEIFLIASDPAQTPETDLVVNIYDYDTTGHTISRVSQNPWTANMRASEVSCLRRIAAAAGDFDADARDEIAFIDDWARTDEDTLHHACTHLLDFSSDLLSIVDSWDRDSIGYAHLHPVSTMSSIVRALTLYKGDLIAAGDFAEAGGITVNRIARWDGSQWHPLGEGVSWRAHALTVYNGDLIAGGEFAEAGGITVNRIARWDGTQWHTLGLGMSYTVFALTVYDNKLIAGGQFENAGEGTVNYIAAWDGSSWSSLGSGMSWHVRALTVYNDTLIAGGLFANAGGTQVNHIASWDSSSESWSALGSGMNGHVYALTVYDNKLIAGGSFTSAGDAPANRIARWDGSEWDSLGSGFNMPVWSLVPFDLFDNGDPVLVAGGEFYVNAGDVRFHRAAWLDESLAWQPFHVNDAGPSSTVLAMMEFNGDLILGGYFEYFWCPYNGGAGPTVQSNKIGRVKRNGSIGLYDSLHAKSDFIVDILADDVDFAFNGADEIIVRGYHDPSSWGDPRLSFWVLGVDSEFTGCYRVGNYAAFGLWGVDGINGSRRTMAVGDFVDDEHNYKDLLILVTDTVDANGTIIHAWEIDTSLLIACGDPGGSNLLCKAGWMDTSETITELITADLDTATIELGAPTHYVVDSIIQPLVVLNVPPVHFDIVNGDTADVNERFPWPPGPDADHDTYCAYGMFQDSSTTVTSEIRKDWGISAGLKTHFSSCGATVKAHLNTEYGEGFSVQGDSTITIHTENVMENHAKDMILATRISYDVWEYPVYRRGEHLEGADVVVLNPRSVEKAWLDGRETESWIPDHEVDNIFSYTNYANPADNPMVSTQNVVEGVSFLMSEGTKGHWLLTKSVITGSGYEASSNFGVEVGASIGYSGGLSFFGLGAKWGFEVSVEGTYDKSELKTYSTTVANADSVHVQYGYINSVGSDVDNRKYYIKPYAYWSKNGALVLNYAASPTGGIGTTWWTEHYSDPDPAFILPWRYDPEKYGAAHNENRYLTREIVFIPSYPAPGDTVLIIARVHNFSLVPTPEEVKVSFYLGDPDNFGQLLYDKNTGDSIFWACDADGVPSVIESQGEVAAQMVWQVPYEGSITGCQRIWAHIDPLDSISPEVHDNDAEITNNKGWNRLDVNTPDICIDRDGDGWEESAFRCHTCAHPQEGEDYDNCPTVYNPDQADSNGDGIGDACQWTCGDANGDFSVNILDITFLIAYLYQGGPPPDPLESGDVNSDLAVNILDITYLIAYLYQSGPEPDCP